MKDCVILFEKKNSGFFFIKTLYKKVQLYFCYGPYDLKTKLIIKYKGREGPFNVKVFYKYILHSEEGI